MSGRGKVAWGLPEAAFWAALEVGSFLFLFLSPLFSHSVMEVVWYGLVLWRVGAMACRVHFTPNPTGRDKIKELGRGMLYGIFFWASALLFPLSTGQVEILTEAFFVYLALTLMVMAAVRFVPGWFPLGATLFTGSVLAWSDRTWLYVLLGFGVCFLALLMESKQRCAAVEVPLEEVRLGALAVSGGWSFLLVWAVMTSGEVGHYLPRALLLWLFVVVNSALVFPAVRAQAEKRRLQREVELSVPALFQGLRWFRSRQVGGHWALWLGYAVAVSGAQVWWALAFILSGLALRNLLAKEYVSALHWQWWCCGQFAFYWGIAESEGPTKYGWLLVGGLLSQAIALSAPDESPEAEQNLAKLEAILRTELSVAAPDYLKRDILAQAEPSVDIDSSLQSPAPKGFRERLLQRLKDTGDE